MNWERKYIRATIRLREALRNQIPVRCKDCKHCKVGRMFAFCDFLCNTEDYLTVLPDDFCAWGEKE